MDGGSGKRARGGKSPGYAVRCPSREERRQRLLENLQQTRRRNRWIIATMTTLIVSGAVLSSVWASKLKRTAGQRRTGIEQSTGKKMTGPGGRLPSSTDPALAAVVEQKKEGDREHAASLAAQQTVMRFLQARDWNEAREFLLGPAAEWESPPAAFDPKLWETASKSPLQQLQSRRIPTSGRLFSTWKVVPGSSEAMTLFVEETADGHRIHWDAIEQQLDGRLASFSRESTSPATRCYVRLGWSREIPPGEDGPLEVEVTSPFNGQDTCTFHAAIDEQNGQAAHWRQLLKISSPRQALAKLQWVQSPGKGAAVMIESLASEPWETPSPSVAATP
jgi:hypothetical protein